jgi:hypothetical protein
MSDLMNPSNPKSPFNRNNFDSPWSVNNPSSSYYDPNSRAAGGGEVFVAAVFLFLCLGLKLGVHWLLSFSFGWVPALLMLVFYVAFIVWLWAIRRYFFVLLFVGVLVFTLMIYWD